MCGFRNVTGLSTARSPTSANKQSAAVGGSSPKFAFIITAADRSTASHAQGLLVLLLLWLTTGTRGKEREREGGRGFQCGADVSSCNGASGTKGVSRSPHARESEEVRE